MTTIAFKNDIVESFGISVWDIRRILHFCMAWEQNESIREMFEAADKHLDLMYGVLDIGVDLPDEACRPLIDHLERMIAEVVPSDRERTGWQMRLTEFVTRIELYLEKTEADKAQPKGSGS